MIFPNFRLLVLSAALLLGGCSASALNVLVTNDGYTVKKDVAYGDLPEQKLDLYIPEGRCSEANPCPLLVFFYGGNWQKGSKDIYRFIGQRFSALGYIVAIPDYRKYPEVTFPGFLTDAAEATAWLEKHARNYGGDAGNLFLAGHSAGAYLAVMLGTDREYLKAAGSDRSHIRGILGIAGPYDFLPLKDDDLKKIFYVVPDAKVTQPITFADGGAPPMLLQHGLDDDTVGKHNTANMAAKLNQAGAHAETKYYDDIGHVGIILQYAQPLHKKSQVVDDAAEFLGRQYSRSTH